MYDGQSCMCTLNVPTATHLHVKGAVTRHSILNTCNFNEGKRYPFSSVHLLYQEVPGTDAPAMQSKTQVNEGKICHSVHQVKVMLCHIHSIIWWQGLETSPRDFKQAHPKPTQARWKWWCTENNHAPPNNDEGENDEDQDDDQHEQEEAPSEDNVHPKQQATRTSDSSHSTTARPWQIEGVVGDIGRNLEQCTGQLQNCPEGGIMQEYCHLDNMNKYPEQVQLLHLNSQVSINNILWHRWQCREVREMTWAVSVVMLWKSKRYCNNILQHWSSLGQFELLK